MAPQTQAPRQFCKRLGWLVLIWSCSVLGLGLLAMLMRALMSLAGMSA